MSGAYTSFYTMYEKKIERMELNIPLLPETEKPIPLHRQIAGHSVWSQIHNSISLARVILQIENYGERHDWARMVLDLLNAD